MQQPGWAIWAGGGGIRAVLRPAIRGALCAAFLAAIPALAWAQAAPRAVTPAEGGAAEHGAAMDYLVQSNCLDREGRIQPGVLPFQADCAHPSPLLPTQGMAYRKHDWPAPEHRPGAPLGYQASDAYVSTLRGLPAAIQTFDFGGGRYRFGQFDAGADGGDAVVLRGEEASIGVSQDSDGVKWLLGEGCRAGGALAPGWLAFQGPQGERVAPNAITPAPSACPRAFSMSLTRWRSARLSFPYLVRGRPAGQFEAPFIVSEHFSHPTVAQSNALERFWFARGLGKVRWEAWVNLSFPGQDVPRLSAQARWFASTQRCPAVEGGVGPNEPGRANWVMVECRTWTNFDLPAPNGGLIPLLTWPAQMENR